MVSLYCDRRKIRDLSSVCENEIEGELHIEMYTLTLIYRPEF